ncbi:MAG: hypothetical protein CMR00_10245 [[Chlorobium] sp. 445]|nr:MAG: hypothetical protein CMR00_10245 [[Chlorobium] sp. 445]
MRKTYEYERMTQRTAILLHGLFDTGKVFLDLSARLHKKGFRTLAPDLVPNDGSVSIATLAAQLKEIIERKVEPSEWLALIGFSMGGIVARYYLQELNGYQRTQRLITISSPHHGSWLAYAAEGEGIKRLATKEPLAAKTQCPCRHAQAAQAALALDPAGFDDCACTQLCVATGNKHSL